jgi:2-oxoglutarate/2-oxoacid ferredoxin oxidoreductase subunit alpha
MRKSLTFVLSGEAGQGLKTIEDFLVKLVSHSYYVFSSQEVMSRVRGGNNTLEVRVANEPVFAYQHTIDYLFLLNTHSFYRLHDRITKDTVIYGEEEFVDREVIERVGATFIPFNVTDLATQAGSVLYGNIVLSGVISGILALEQDLAKNIITDQFKHKSEKIQLGNIEAFSLGYRYGENLNLPNPIQKNEKSRALKSLTGNEAIGIGAIAGGCNFIASYPMSPGTGVLIYLAEQSNDYEILVEQAEDEIAALNMVIGGWYAGARGLVTTSGGGFALMEEAVSLSGITETPCVIHIGQRPGPGTGLPTRTGQEDLNLAVYSGHGEFARIVLAPGTLEDGVLLAQKAFYLADKYQVPVFILSDQFYLDSIGQMERIRLEDAPLESFVVETTEDYKRYQYTDSGLSPRGIPGFGQGLVKVDSDEHDEYGAITESFEVRVKMNDKRLARKGLILQDYIEPELHGAQNFKNLVIGWGSTYGVLREFIETTDNTETAYLYIKQLYPLSDSLKAFTQQAENIIVVENNATGQLSNLLKLELDIKTNHHILKYNGMPFTNEEIDQRLEEVLL